MKELKKKYFFYCKTRSVDAICEEYWSLYKILTISAFHLSKPTFQAELDENFERWGEEGWELVKMEPVNGGAWIFWGRTSKFLTVFKREKL